MPAHFNGSHFRGLPVLTSAGPLVKQYLERTYDTLGCALAHHGRFLAIRVDLHFPRYYWPLEGRRLGNDYLTRFMASLDAKIDHSQLRTAKQGTRVHPSHLRYIWAREFGPDGIGKPHFHLVCLLNGHAYRSPGRLGYRDECLLGMIREAWASALGLQPFEVKGCVQACGYHFVEPYDHAALGDVFEAASYLCKARSKNFSEGCHAFGHSRL